jgi:hypothetical protein
LRFSADGWPGVTVAMPIGGGGGAPQID